MKISFSIIGYNETDLIKGCLESIKDIAYEIVYVDCSSTDNSIEIVKKYTDKIFIRENNFNLNINKQFGIDKCTGDWIFYIDPDERLTNDLKREIIETIKNTNCNGFLIPRKNYYFGKWLRYGGKYPDKQLRLFRNGKGRFACVSIHERISIEGEIGSLKNPFEHIVFDSIDRMILKMGSYSYRGGIEIVRLNKNQNIILFKSIRNFFKNYFLKLGFMDGIIGFFVAIHDLFNFFLYYFKSKELKNDKKLY